MNGVPFDMSDATSDFAKAALEYELGMIENAYGYVKLRMGFRSKTWI